MNTSVPIRYFACWVMLVCGAGCASSPAPVAAGFEPHALTPFQWSVSTDAVRLVIPVGDNYLYPAKRVGGVLESMPLQIEVSVDALGEQRIVLLQDVIAPQEISPADWNLQVLRDGAWRTFSDFQFDGERFRFAGQQSAAFSEIRFTRR